MLKRGNFPLAPFFKNSCPVSSRVNQKLFIFIGRAELSVGSAFKSSRCQRCFEDCVCEISLGICCHVKDLIFSLQELPFFCFKLSCGPLNFFQGKFCDSLVFGQQLR
eukprot:NODE_63_length_2781_cov_44.411054_g59_i0.p9 GENE.NODE_63_length_2781_cov_44.411054_g59_i0~~NODE_63_length_2781_cov_44.411054_g59_i0.p9  ORF type:complete len:107 (+),score=4.15 NODE_63_length_2781_cov_44.411054_g59_i0:131-451(+)